MVHPGKQIAPALRTPIDTRVRARIEEMVKRGKVPGCSWALLDPGGQVHCGACGQADLRKGLPATEDTIYHLFSGTKLYTAAALMLLQERGLLRLDETVASYLGDLPLRHPVTLRQLASHNSGLHDTMSGFFAVHLQSEAMPSTADALRRYRLDNGKPPGRGAAYRNVNYAILGEVISRVSEQPYTAFVTKALLEPLGARVGFEYDDALAEHEALGYIDRLSPMRLLLRVLPGQIQRIEGDRVGGRIELASIVLDTAAIGGLVGSAKAFLPLVSEFLSRDDGVLSAESKRAMLGLQARGKAGVASTIGVGLGWKLGRTRSGIEFCNHEGGGPGFTSETRIYPAQGVGAVIMMNATHTAKLSWIAHDICELLRASCQSSEGGG